MAVIDDLSPALYELPEAKRGGAGFANMLWAERGAIGGEHSTGLRLSAARQAGSAYMALHIITESSLSPFGCSWRSATRLLAA